MTTGRTVLEETFPGDDLDREVWSPHYLPAVELARGGGGDARGS